jgi:pyrimidine operon attenuation protein/uracil phosphoribosyltransferase
MKDSVLYEGQPMFIRRINGEGENIPWPEDFPQLINMTNLGTLMMEKTGNLDLMKRAKKGDETAAFQLVNKLSKDDKIIEMGKKYPDALIVPVHAVEASGLNVLPIHYAEKIHKLTGLEVYKGIVQINKAQRTQKTRIERLFQDVMFDGEVKKDYNYIIVDDVVTQGRTIRSLKDYIEQNGGKVVAVTALAPGRSTNMSAGQSSKQISITKKTIELLKERFGYERFDKALKEFNIANTVEELTESEGTDILKSFGSLESFRNRGLEETSKRGIGLGTGNVSQAGRRAGEKTEGRAGEKASENQEEINNVDEPMFSRRRRDRSDNLTSQLDMELPPASGANTSGEARRASEIIKDFEKRFLNKVRVGKINRANVLGYFQIRSHVIRLRKANDIPTFTHEAGHLIDKLYRLSRVGTMNQRGVDVAKVRDELLRLGNHTTQSNDDLKLRKEGIAEFTRLYLTDQPQAFSRAPETFEYFKKAIDPDLMGFLDERMQDIWNLVNLKPEDRVMRDVWDRSEVEKARREAETLRLKLEQFYTQTVDEYFPAIKDAKELAGKEGEKRIKQIIAQNRGYESSAMFSVNPKGINGMYQSDLYGNNVGPSLFEILEPLSNNIEKQDYFWKSYAVGRRAEDYDARKLQLPNDIETYRQDVKNLEIKYPDFPDIFKRVREYDDNLLNILVQAGFFSKAQADKIRKENPNHIHLFRVHDDGLSKQSSRGNPVKRLKGGGQEILNPYESMVNMTFTIWGAAKRQQLLLELADMADEAEGKGAVMVKSPYEFKVTEFNLNEVKKQIIESLLQQGVNLDKFYKGFDIDLEFDTMVKIFRPNFFAKNNQLAIYRNGKIVLYDVEPELYKALSGMNPVTFNTAMKFVMNVMMKVGDFQAANILYTPRFVVWNTVRESLTAWLQTRAGISVLDIAKGAVSVMKHDPWFLEAMKRGGTTEMFLANESRFVKDTIKELSLGRSKVKRVFNKIRHPLNTLRDTIKFTELGTKTAEAKKTVENRLIQRFADQIGKGVFVTKILKWIDPNIRQQWKTFFDITNTTKEDWDEAIFNMRDLTYDIKRKGKTVKDLNINRIWRFFNAYVQGLDQMVRTAKDPERNKRLLIRGALLALFSMFMFSLIKDNEMYKKLKPYQKDNFWNIPIGDPKTTKIFIPIPRVFEWTIPFMAVPVRAMDYFWNDNPDAWDGFATSLRNNFLFEIEPMPIRPFIEQLTNTTWQGAPIENYGDKMVSPANRYDDRTSEVAKGISKVTNQLPFTFEAIQSPKRLDHLIRGFTATTGAVAISAIDEVAGKPNYKASDLLNDLPYLRGLKNVPGLNAILSGFVLDAQRSSTIREDYYEGRDAAAKAYNDFKRTGILTQEGAEQIALHKVYNKLDNMISELNKAKKSLEKNNNEKSKKQIKNIDNAIFNIQKDMLAVSKKMKK